MSDDKNLDAQAEALGAKMFESFQAEQKKALEAEEKAKAEAKAEADKKVAKIAHPVDGKLGVSKSTFDYQIDKLFSEENVERLAGKQTEKEMIEAKNALFLRGLVGMKLYPHDSRFVIAVKALSEGTDADGGYLVDPEFRGEVIRQLHHNGIMRPEVNVVPTTKDSVQFNKEDGRPLVSWGSENTAISTTTAGLAQTTINVHRMNTIMYMSRELVADSDPSVTAWINSELVDSVRNEEDAVIIGGSGTGRPKGLTQLTLTTNAAGASLTFEDWIDLEHTLPVQYRGGTEKANVKFYMNDLTLRDTRKLKDDQGMPIYQRALEANAPDTLLGYPVIVHNNFPEGTVFFGNLKRAYFLLDRQSISMETTTEGGDTFAKHQVGIKLTERIGGDTVRSEALIKGTGYSA